MEVAKEALSSIEQNGVFELADLPVGRRAISSKWVFKAKLDFNGEIHRYKARLVARGFSQRYGQDYDETFAPVVKHETVRVLLAIAAIRGLHVRHLDVRSAFLNGELDEELYMEKPQGIDVSGAEQKVFRLPKSIYGLKQSARAWNGTASETLARIGFQQGNADQCLFSRKECNGDTTYVLIYVDDLVFGSTEEVTQQVGLQLDKFFEIKNLGDVRHF